MPVETALALALVVAAAEVVGRTVEVVARAPEVAVGVAGAAEPLPVQSTLPSDLPLRYLTTLPCYLLMSSRAGCLYEQDAS